MEEKILGLFFFWGGGSEEKLETTDSKYAFDANRTKCKN